MTEYSYRILTHNIHKGFSIFNKFTLLELQKELSYSKADFIFLQEIVGFHMDHDSLKSQLEILADSLWPHYAYGKNSAYFEGHHGNAILSKYPIESFSNTDLSQGKWDLRGLLHVRVTANEHPVHLLCIHLGLLASYRKRQLTTVSNYIHKNIGTKESVILAGDFNDWTHKSTHFLAEKLGFIEAFEALGISVPATFPSFFPVLSLDHIYVKNLAVRSASRMTEPPWNRLSDHLPLVADLVDITRVSIS